MNNDWIKTGIFAGIGLFLAIIAGTVYYSSLPDKDIVAQRLGTAFFHEFENVDQAHKIRITGFNDKGEQQEILLEKNDNLWSLASHNHYPAEAFDRLANTASTLLGLTRQAIVSREIDQQANYHVGDPQAEDADPEECGKRVTIWDGSGNVIADLIVGDAIEGEEFDENEFGAKEEKQIPRHHVRHPDENETYQVDLAVNFSDQFVDWIEPKLLDVEETDLIGIDFENYKIKPEIVKIRNREVQLDFKSEVKNEKIERQSGLDTWTYAGVNETTEELNSNNIDKLARLVANLTISGVRKKFEFNGQVVFDANLQFHNTHPQLLNHARQELLAYGFDVINIDKQGEKWTIASAVEKGELVVSTSEGLRYTVYFGKDFEGNRQDVQVGESGKSGKDQEPDKRDETKPSDKKENRTHRYMMVKVDFDRDLLGEPPTRPLRPFEPVKPEALKQIDLFAMDAPDLPPLPPATQRLSPRAKLQSEYDTSMAEYNASKAKYDADLSQFERDLQTHEDQIRAGQQKVARLNERFGLWFYVIDVDELKDLVVNRDLLVSKKAPDLTTPGKVPNIDLPPGIELPK